MPLFKSLLLILFLSFNVAETAYSEEIKAVNIQHHIFQDSLTQQSATHLENSFNELVKGQLVKDEFGKLEELIQISKINRVKNTLDPDLSNKTQAFIIESIWQEWKTADPYLQKNVELFSNSTFGFPMDKSEEKNNTIYSSITKLSNALYELDLTSENQKANSLPNQNTTYSSIPSMPISNTLWLLISSAIGFIGFKKNDTTALSN